MSKKLILFLMVLLLGSTSFLRAEVLTVHDGTATNSYVPVYGFYADAYLKCEMVFPAAELADMENGTITGMTFYASTPASEAWTGTFQVFVAEVADATISSFAGPGTVVYEGTLDGTQSSMAITFSAPYAYNGGNLLVGVYCTEKGNYKSVTWAGEVVDGASVQGYSYNDITAITASQRNFLPKTTFTYTPGSGPTPPTPPTPTGDLTINPNPFAMGDRPMNAWMEPYEVKITNGGDETTIEGTLSNTSGATPFALSEPVAATLATGDSFTFDININTTADEGEYTEEFTLFYTGGEKSIVTIPVTSMLYTAGTPDVVEKAGTIALSYTGGEATFTDTPVAEDIHPNYILQGMTSRVRDAVYSMNLTKDSKVTINTGDGIIAIYNKVTGFQPTAAIEPVVMVDNGALVEETLLKGNYYVVVASNAFETIDVTVQQYPAPSALTALAPEDGATGLDGTIELEWEGGENATQYQVLFGTSPTSLPVVLDWTAVDDNYGTFDVSGLVQNNTQYFWMIKAKNSEGTVSTTRRGFTTALTAPHSVTASEQQIFTDGSTLIKWKHNAGGGFSGEITVAEGTETSSYIPVYGLWMDDYTRSEMIYPEEMIEEMTGGDITSLTYYISQAATGPWTGDVFNVYLMEVPTTTLSSYYTSADATIVYTGALDGQGTTMTINFDTPYTYSGGNLLVGIEETVCGTYKSCYFYGVTATGASSSGYSSSSLAAVTFNQRNFLPKTTFVCGGKKDQTRGFLGYNLYYGDVKVNTNLLTERQYLLSDLPYNMTGHDINVTAVYDEGESGHSSPEVLVQVSGYATLTGHVNELISGAPIAGVNVKFNGKDEFNNDVMFEGTTNASGLYTITVKAGTYNRGVATLAGNEPATMADPVTVAYQGTETVNFIMHESYNPVYKVYAQEIDPSMSKVTWSLNDFSTVTPGGGGGTGVGTLTYNFDDNTMMGWTSIDGDGDGNGWVSSANPGIYHNSGVSLSGTGHNDSEAYVISGSYANQTGQALTPNNFLVSPQKAAYASITFYACAQDASYAAEHYGVAVSTTGNTSAADFTTIAEWTMTAKGEGAMSVGRGGQTRQGVWYEKTVDLSSYAGQDIWVAIRHFNCTDMFILNVDDIELSGSAKDRSVQSYTLYRKAILKEAAIVPADSVMLVEGATDTLYADFNWNNMLAGLYQYGVSAVYPSPAKGGSRDEVIIGTGTATNSYVPTYNLYNYSCTNQIYTAEEIGGECTINSIAFMPSLVNTASRNVNIYMVNTDKQTFTGATDWIPVTDADLVYSGTVNWVANEWCAATLTTPFAFDGTNLCVVVNDLTGSWTSSNQYYVSDATAQALRIYQDSAPYNPAAPGSGTVLNVKNNIKLDVTFGGGGGGGNDNPVTPITWSNVLPKDMETTVTVNVAIAEGSLEGTLVSFINQFEEGTDFTATLEEDGTVTFENFRKGEYLLTVDLPGYISPYADEPMSIWDETTIDVELQEIFKPVDDLAVSITGYARWTPVIPVDRIPERYFVTLNGVLVVETTDNYYQFEDLVEGTTYTAAVAVVYSTGMSAYVTKNFTYQGCEGVATQVEGLAVDSTNCQNMNVVLVWNGGTPTPTPPTPPTPPTGNTYDFDDGTFQGWTTIDGNNDGYDWVLGSQIGGVYLVAGASLAGSGHNSSADLVCSGSYSNYTSSAITPNNFLVSPAKAEYTGISFFACGQDASYVAEHFGVAVSTGGATASEFTIVQEWTMTAKGEGAMSIGRDGQTRAQGSWHEYTVDLSSYAGQEIWVAIRHFNCNDMFILDVDDITLGVPEKATMDFDPNASVVSAPTRDMWDLVTTFNAAEGGQYGVVTDGEYFYTSNWGYSSAAHNFWKYDLDGNQVEGFDISGCGTLRGMTFDGEYVYGVANSSTIYCVDLNNHTLVGTTSSAYGAMRGITYDPERDGFWVIGNWSGNLTLVDRTGAIQLTGPAPTSASDLAYYKDEDGNEHVYCFNNGTNDVDDYNITTGTMTTAVFNFSSTPGFDGGSSGGCHVANYAGKTCFIGDIQQSPNLIGIYELREAGGGAATSYTPNKFNILVDGEVVAATANSYYTYECPDYDNHVYTVIFVDANYGISCEASVEYEIHHLNVAENELVNSIYPNPTSGDLHINAEAMTRISIVNAMGQVVYEQNVNADEVVLDMAKYEAGVYMVNIFTENGSSVKRVTVVK